VDIGYSKEGYGKWEKVIVRWIKVIVKWIKVIVTPSKQANRRRFRHLDNNV
jgi:hypothetical protein